MLPCQFKYLYARQILPLNPTVQRYPPSLNKTFQAWNAADELIVKYARENVLEHSLIIHDRFGYLTLNLNDAVSDALILWKSQQHSISKNIDLNNAKLNGRLTIATEENKTAYDNIYIHVPKSLELFEYYLQYAHDHLKPSGGIVCGFMTRHFSPKMIELLSKYFEESTQSSAVKKARIITSKKKKDVLPFKELEEINYKDHSFKQFSGVFSSGHIDYATQFLLQHLKLDDDVKTVVDFGCGNGVIGWHCLQLKENIDVHFVDDFLLAIESAKLNVASSNAFFHWQDSMLEEEIPDDCSLIITNPPFHFEHENDISVSLQLFKDARKKLAVNGKLIVVANKHLNYATHLRVEFSVVEHVAENEKFIIYKCS